MEYVVHLQTARCIFEILLQTCSALLGMLELRQKRFAFLHPGLLGHGVCSFLLSNSASESIAQDDLALIFQLAGVSKLEREE